jgi:hypothetical protein
MRELGYYWINIGWKMPDEMEDDQAWIVAEYMGNGKWSLTETGQSSCFSCTEKEKILSESHITEIDENKLIRK